MTDCTFTITLPGLPDPNLSPNSRVSWAVRYRATLVAKDEVVALVREQGWFRAPIQGKVVLKITWCPADRRRRDYDNLVGAMKPYIDALVVAGVLVDDNAGRLSLVLDYRPEVELRQTVMELTWEE